MPPIQSAFFGQGQQGLVYLRQIFARRSHGRSIHARMRAALANLDQGEFAEGDVQRSQRLMSEFALKSRNGAFKVVLSRAEARL